MISTKTLAGVGLVSAFFAGCAKPPAPPQALPGVVAATPLRQAVTDWDDYAGRFEAVDTVEVRPRVAGAIDSVHFEDGQHVRKGQLLFVIDPRPSMRSWPRRAPIWRGRAPRSPTRMRNSSAPKRWSRII